MLKEKRPYTKRYSKPIEQHKVHHSVEEYGLVYELLELLGYDTENNIHKQFCEKHNLFFDEKKRRKLSKYNKNFY